MKILNYLSFVLALAGVVVAAWLYVSQPKSAYVELDKVFDAFELKKELEADLEKIGKIKLGQVDSLKLVMESMQRDMSASGKKDSETIKKYQQEAYEVAYKKQQVEENIEILKQEYNDRIWKQLNQYLRDYGHENKYEFLFGASGSGSIMYAKKENNMTDEVIIYVNKRYQGKK
ncbi:MAG: hypothetical protein POELPBGB_03620 [Bacteroidia bacterium]|nr:hypothetical protein [Bacteroidia bacterium]